MVFVVLSENQSLVNSFLETVTGVEGQRLASISTPHLFFLVNSSIEILSLPRGTSMSSSPLLISNNQLSFEVSSVELISQRCILQGYTILAECSASGAALCVIQGPENIRVVVIERKQESQDIPLSQVIASWIADDNKGKVEKSSSAETWNPPRGKPIPTLFPSVLHNGRFERIYPNSSAPVPYKTEYFEGHVLLVVRTTPMDSTYPHVFQKSNTCFEVQAQGKFTKIPQGKLFIGILPQYIFLTIISSLIYMPYILYIFINLYYNILYRC
jgi:hypothetical protein